MSKRKIILTSIISVISAFLLFVICYVGYILISYYRIEDNFVLEIDSASTLDAVNTNEEYSISTYNIGFGAYSQDYTFFLDSGYNADGKEVTGYYSTARSKEEVLFNTNGAIDTIKTLNDANINYFGFEEYYVYSKDNINN